MTKPRPQPPAPEDLPQLYLALLRRLEKVEGTVRQLAAEGTRDGLRPTWRDLQDLRADLDRLRNAARHGQK